MNPDQLILALDVSDAGVALDWVRRFNHQIGCFKIGLQLFTAQGPDFVREVRQTGAQVFLDLKLHDIPNTVAKAVEAACQLDIQYLTVHTLGGRAMLTAALAAAAPTPRTMLLGITVLTSHDNDDLDDLGFDHTAAGQALLLAKLARSAGMRGLVCSPREVTLLRQELGTDFTLVTPGVRPAGAAVNDQNRVTTPAEAIASGSSHLVIGRPILNAPDPEQVIAGILSGGG
ncbi:MAG: orotidine-5'-phosphate decarboxylase [Verrucomicrobiales bacterium]|jgi:orotidine-5'-phosphate decarboxylase|nr:orotidine-5'-phosphate decarboxylase [Verrucomicrobiales bacterium]